ncbi:MAG: extracellular solute-binding protein [Leptolyngbyaceae cyanobacterium MO_188.B28]|nr:extracellular solute-binding protein [Leptolyngbyaceae cyanobacterium MO_188.B28]
MEQLLTACSRLRRSSLRISLLENSISPQILREFRRQVTQPADLDFSSEEQLAKLFKLLQTWRNPEEKASGLSRFMPIKRTPSASRADLATLGDYWLATAIQQDLIQPMELSRLKGWPSLSERWRTLVRRDRSGLLTPQGEVWGAPYRWGSLIMVYRDPPFKSLDWRPTNWSDLWRPELKQRISLPDHPRLVIGIALQSLGHSCNETDLGRVPNLADKLAQLHQEQIKFYSSDTYLQPLINEDTWLAVGWSTDILPTIQRYRQLKAVIPEPGSLLTADVWVRPAKIESNGIESNGEDNADTAQTPTADLIQQWLDFCWSPQVATQLSISSQGASPIFSETAPSDLPNALQNNPLLLPKPETFRQSEFLEPFSEAINNKYLTLWTKVRQD